MRNRKGFTMVELLVVLAIIGILAAVATPLYLENTRKAKAAEAVATMGLIRQALRDYRVNNATYFDITSPNTPNALPTSVAAGVPTPATAGVTVNAGTAQYFSNAAFSVDATAPASARFANPAPVDFLITANGANSVACAGVLTDCAVKAAEVQGAGTAYQLEMDNSGRIFVSYDAGATWGAY